MADEKTVECAAAVMETIPMIMRTIGAEMRSRHRVDLPMPQFGALMFLKHHGGASLSFLARHRGSSVSSASKLVDGLVERGYVSRDTASEDRRRVALGLTEFGEATLESFHKEEAGYLAEILATLSEGQRTTVMKGMELLRSVLAPALAAESGGTTRLGGPGCE